MSANVDLSNYSMPSNGITGGYTGDNVNILRAMIAFSAIAWYNCAELIFLICLRFKRWRGLYFWSLMATSWAIVLYQIGSWGKMRNLVAAPAAMTVITNVGWIAMITGNSLVLYSRLHLLCQNQTLLKCVLYGIIANTVCMYVPTTALDIGSNVVHPGNPTYVNGYSIMERIQMTMFTVQEFAISGIYLVEAYRYLKVAYAGDKRSRNVIYELLAVNVTIIILDIALLAVAHRDLFQIEVTLKGLVYSVKLKLELGVLSRLVRIVTNNGSALGRTVTFDNDLANLSDEPKAFGGLDFCTSPIPEKSDPTIKTSSSTASHQENISPHTRANSVPWLMTNTRSVLVEPPPPPRPPPPPPHVPHPSSRVIRHPVRRPKSHPYNAHSTERHFSRRNTRDSNQSPLRPPPVQRPTQHTIQRGESYANSEFLTSAAVTEGANDETLRQFQKEIEAELGMGMEVARVVPHGSLPGSGEGSEVTLTSEGEMKEEEGEGKEVGRVDVQPGSAVAKEEERKVKGFKTEEEGEGDGDEEEDQDEEEEEWARNLGVLGPERPVLSRESSLGRMYPGRITGEKG